MESLPPVVFETVGVIGLVVALFWLLATGRLATRRELDKAEHDRDEWRTESRIKDQQMQVKDEQLAHLAEVGKTVDAIMRALKSGPPRGGAV